MSSALFTIDQAGLPAGILDRSRTDGLLSGALVTLTAAGPGSTFRFRLLWVPPGDTTAVASLTAVTANQWTFSPTAAVWGTYRIELIVDEGLSTEKRSVRLLRVRNTGGLTDFALNERAAPTNTLASTTGASEDNAADYPDPAISSLVYAGWWRVQHELVQTVAGLVVGGAGTGVVDTIGRIAGAGLRAIVGTVGQAITVRGYDTAGDDGGGLFVWVASSAANNDGTIIVPGVAYGANTAGNHWRRVQPGGAFDVRWFGAHGDYDPVTLTGGTTDTAGILRAVAALSTECWSLDFPDGIYKIQSPIPVLTNYTFRGRGAPILWGVAVSSVLFIGSTGPNTIADSWSLSDLTILGSGTSAIELMAGQGGVAERVFIGGTYTHGVHSEYTSGQSGVAYNCRLEFRRFAWAVGRFAFPEPPSPDNGVWVYGAWTATDLTVDWINVDDYSVRIEAQGPATGLGNLRIHGMVQGAGIFGGLGIAIKLIGVTGAKIDDLYTEGNLTDIDLESCEGGSVDSAYANVKLRSCTGVTVLNAIRVDSDTSNCGITINGQLTTSEQPACGIVGGGVGLVTNHFAREVTRQGIWVSGALPADPHQLNVNGGMRRFNSSGTCTLWGTTSWSTFTTTQTGVGLGDTTRTDGSPNACKIVQAGDGVMAVKLCGPLPAGYLGAEITFSFKLKIIANGLAAACQVTDLTNVAWDPTAPTVDLFNAGGLSAAANPIPAESGFSLFRITRRVTAAMVANGLQVVFLCYATGEFYLSELQAAFGRASPRVYQPGRTLGGELVELQNGAIQVHGSVAPVSATDPFYGEPWLLGDRCLATAPSPGTPESWTVTAASPLVWTPTIPTRSAARTVAGTTDTILAADYGSVVDYSNAGAIAVTVPASLPEGFYCTLLQSGTGPFTIAGVGSTVNGRNGLTSAGQYAAVGIQQRAANTYIVGGDTV